VRIFLAGLWSRRWLNLGLFALGVLAVAAAVAGPLFARSAAEYLLDTSAAAAPTTESGVHVEVTPYEVLDGSGTAEKTPLAMTDTTRRRMLGSTDILQEEGDLDRFWDAPVRYVVSTGQLVVGGRRYGINAYWREDMCDHAVVEGRCPSAPGEALMDPTMLETLGDAVGDTITITYPTAGIRPDGKGARQDVDQTYTIVGTYAIADPDDTYWYDPGRTGGDGTLRPAGLGSQVVPQAPALLVDQSSITLARPTIGGSDRALDLDRFDIATMDQAEAALQEWNQLYDVFGEPAVGGVAVNSLSGLIAEVEKEHLLLSRVSVSSAVPLIVLALLMLYVLGAAAAEARRPEVALGKLRGHSRSRIALFAMSESFVVLLLAVPAGAVVGVLANRVLTRLWLGETPLVVTPQTWVALAVVAGAALVATAVAVVGVVREPVNDSLTVATRRRVPSRLTLLLRGGLVAVAVAAVVQIRSRDVKASSSYLELLTPLFVGLAASVLAVPVVVAAARLWVRRTTTRGGTSPFLASRRLARRRDAATLVLPFLLATTITVFAFSAWRVADDWRVSRAAADVGAATSYVTETPPDELLRITHRVDPDGRYLAAAVPAASRTQDGARVALVDSTRFAAVAAWDDSWGASPGQVQKWLTAPDAGRPVTFTGAHVTVELADIALEGDLNLPLGLGLRYTAADTGRETVVQLGEVPLSGATTLTGATPGCEQACTLEQLYLAGSSDSVTNAHGSFLVRSIAADGSEPGEWRLDDQSAWRPARPYDQDDRPTATVEGGADGLLVTTRKRVTAIIRITTVDVPEAPPVVMTNGSSLESDGTGLVTGASLLGLRTPMQLTGSADSLPLVGTSGGLSDLASALREYGDHVGEVPITHLLVAPGTPASVLQDVEDAGVLLDTRRSEAEELTQLRTDPFSIAWKGFLFAGLASLALAFLGLAAMALVQLRWRAYEVAALRVVGVRRRVLRRAVVTEYVALLGTAVLAGAASALLSLWLLLPSMDLGAATAFEPVPDFGPRWSVVALVVGSGILVAVLLALWIAWRTIVRGTPDRLRQADIG
jgi:hypothetical protein